MSSIQSEYANNYYNNAILTVNYNCEQTTKEFFNNVIQNPKEHVVEFFRGFVGKRIQFLGAGIESAVGTVWSGLTAVRKVFNIVIIQPIHLIGNLAQFRHPTNNLFFDVSLLELQIEVVATYEGLLKTSNCIVGVAVPAFAAMIDNRLRNYLVF